VLLNKFFQIQTCYKTESDKVRILIEVTKKFSEVYHPQEDIVLDEGMGPFRGRFKYLCYNPIKPDKWGIKFFGYCLNVVPYFGSQTNDDDSATDSIVKQMLQDYENYNHKLYFDSYYCHPSLVYELKQKSIYCTGTFRKSRRDIPKSLKEMTDSSLKPDEIKVYCYKDEVLCGTWRDKRLVNMITSFDCFKRVTYIDKGKIHSKPEVVFNYNQNLRGVDLLNQLCSYFR